MADSLHDPAGWADIYRKAQAELLGHWSRLANDAGAGSGTPPFPGGPDWSTLLAPGLPGTPALGLTRQQQESAQRMQRLYNDYATQQARLTALWSQVVNDAMKDLAERVGERLREGQAVDSGRQFYDLWIECAEERFARAAHSPEYAKAQAELANTGARLRTEQRRAVEVMSRQLDLPTRAELNTVHLRIKALQTQLRALEAKLPASKPARSRTKPST